MIFSEEPVFVETVGVTINEIELSDVFIQDILLFSPYEPFNAEIYWLGRTVEGEATLLCIIGELPILPGSPIATNIVKSGSKGIYGINALMVTVISVFAGINRKPEIMTWLFPIKSYSTF